MVLPQIVQKPKEYCEEEKTNLGSKVSAARFLRSALASPLILSGGAVSVSPYFVLLSLARSRYFCSLSRFSISSTSASVIFCCRHASRLRWNSSLMINLFQTSQCRDTLSITCQMKLGHLHVFLQKFPRLQLSLAQQTSRALPINQAVFSGLIFRVG